MANSETGTGMHIASISYFVTSVIEVTMTFDGVAAVDNKQLVRRPFEEPSLGKSSSEEKLDSEKVRPCSQNLKAM